MFRWFSFGSIVLTMATVSFTAVAETTTFPLKLSSIITLNPDNHVVTPDCERVCVYHSQYEHEDEFGDVYDTEDDGSDAEQFYHDQKSLSDPDERKYAFFHRRYLRYSPTTTASLILGKLRYNDPDYDLKGGAYTSDLKLIKFHNGVQESVTTCSFPFNSFSNIRFLNNRYLCTDGSSIHNSRLDQHYSGYTCIDLDLMEEVFSADLGNDFTLKNDQIRWVYNPTKTSFRYFSVDNFETIRINHYEVFPRFKIDPGNELEFGDLEADYFELTQWLESENPDVIEFNGYLFNRYYDLTNSDEKQTFEEDKKNLPLTRVRIEGISQLGKFYEPKKSFSENPLKITKTLLPDKYERRDSVGMIWKVSDGSDADIFYQQQLELNTESDRLDVLRYVRFFYDHLEGTTVTLLNSPQSDKIVSVARNYQGQSKIAEFTLPGFSNFLNYAQTGSGVINATVLKMFDPGKLWFSFEEKSYQKGIYIDIIRQKILAELKAKKFLFHGDCLLSYVKDYGGPSETKDPWFELTVNNRFKIFPYFQELNDDGTPNSEKKRHEWVKSFIPIENPEFQYNGDISFEGYVLNRHYNWNLESDKIELKKVLAETTPSQVLIRRVSELGTLQYPAQWGTQYNINVEIYPLKYKREPIFLERYNW